jgi:hypothetical protein
MNKRLVTRSLNDNAARNLVNFMMRFCTSEFLLLFVHDRRHQGNDPAFELVVGIPDAGDVLRAEPQV